jgi:hypothetical protein
MSRYLVLATGSRSWPDSEKYPKYHEAQDMVDCLLLTLKGIWVSSPNSLLVIHGGAEGFDTVVENLCGHLGIATEVWRPEYHLYQEQDKWLAPLHRNTQMVEEGPQLVLAGFVGNPEKGGTLDTTNKARRKPRK